MRSKLRKGEIAEALFVAKALSLGMNVSKPFGQNCRYDFMVEVMGRASRVQVKSTWVASRTPRVAGEDELQLPQMNADQRRSELQELSSQAIQRGSDRDPSTRARSAPSLRMTKEEASLRMTGGREYVVRAGGTTTRGARRYRASEVDYIAAYVGPEDAWYVIPVGRIPSAFTIVLPGRCARFREAWDQLCPRGTYVGDIKACADPNSGFAL